LIASPVEVMAAIFYTRGSIISLERQPSPVAVERRRPHPCVSVAHVVRYADDVVQYLAKAAQSSLYSPYSNHIRQNSSALNVVHSLRAELARTVR
jgi:hypothetical protein